MDRLNQSGDEAGRSPEAEAGEPRDMEAGRSHEVLADGMESTRQIAAQMAPDRVETSQIQYGSQTLPQDGGGAITRALLRGERHEVEDGHDDNQLASAAVMTAAD